jgi:hypothetical protein
LGKVGQVNDSTRTLGISYQALIAPPYGLNTASAGLMLGLLIGGAHPPRRLEQSGQMIASADWLSDAFPTQRGKHAEEQAQRSIMQVEKRQHFKLTLDESDDYPRQPAPTDSTPARELHDGIAKGDALIDALDEARSALSEEEIRARVKAIQDGQQRLREALDRQRAILGALLMGRRQELLAWLARQVAPC